MKADTYSIANVFSRGGDIHYFLLHFQRQYAWDKGNWQTLLDDINGIYNEASNDTPVHFMGAMVVIHDGMRRNVPAFKLVDGQQRLTTISLLLCVLGRLVKTSHPKIAQYVQRLLINEYEPELLHYKLLPTTKYGDRDIFCSIVDNVEIPPNPQSRVYQAFQYFKDALEPQIIGEKIDPERYYHVITNALQVVRIDLDRHERPYEIFESLNAKGRPLSQADLVRNYIALKLPESDQEKVFTNHWSPIEDMLQEQRIVGRSRLGELTAFIRHYLAWRMGVLCPEDHVYERFRDRGEKNFTDSASFTLEMATLKQYAVYYSRLLRPEEEQDNEISSRLKRLNVMEITTAYPFLLGVYDAYQRSQISRIDFIAGLDALENYTVRRYLAGEQSNFTNKMYPTLYREINLSQFASSLRAALLSKRYPNDQRLRTVAITDDLYDKQSQTRGKLVLILETVNRYLSDGTGGYTVLDSSPTIEHILPQTLSKDWEAHLGQVAKQIHEEYLNTLGNLTLITQEWNSTLSNAPFSMKKAKLAANALRINADYFSRDIDKWDEKAIQTRAEFIMNSIIQHWPSFGELTKTNSNTKPVSLTLRDEQFSVDSWRDVANQTAIYVARITEDFDKIAQSMPTFFSREERSRSRQLESGWWISLNLTQKSAQNICRNLLTSAGLADDEWDIETT